MKTWGHPRQAYRLLSSPCLPPTRSFLRIYALSFRLFACVYRIFSLCFLGTYSLLLAHLRPFLPALFSCSPCISALSDKFFSVTACCHRGADGGRDICHEKAGKKKIKQKQNRDNWSLGNQDYPHQLLGG